MIAIPLGASGRSTVQRSTRNAPPSSHSNRTRPSPGHGGPPGGVACIVHSPTKRSSALSIASAVGWFTASAPPSPAGDSSCGVWHTPSPGCVAPAGRSRRRRAGHAGQHGANTAPILNTSDYVLGSRGRLRDIMTSVLLELVRHKTWATRKLIALCQSVDPALIDATSPGTYGTIR